MNIWIAVSFFLYMFSSVVLIRIEHGRKKKKSPGHLIKQNEIQPNDKKTAATSGSSRSLQTIFRQKPRQTP